MGMGAAAGGGGGGRRRRGRKKAVMSEINITPMVDVMLVLLIIFMVAAPMLTVGVPIDLPETQAKAMNADTQPITISVNQGGQIYLQETEIPLEEVVAKLGSRAKAAWMRPSRRPTAAATVGSERPLRSSAFHRRWFCGGR